MRIDEDSSAYSESFKRMGVPQGQGDSSAPSTTDPLICGFCLVTTPNTRSKTVEQSIVTWMFARQFITNNRHPGEPQLTNKPCTNGRLREKHNCTDGQVETSIPPFQLRWSGRYNNFLVLTGNVFLQLGLLVIDKGKEMTHWYWLQFIMTHKMCSTCSTSSQIRKDGIIQASLVVVFENIKGPTHLVEKVATT